MTTKYIVKGSAARMPATCWGRYGRIAVIEVVEGTTPKMISHRAKGVVRIVSTWERLHIGYTDKDAFTKAWKEAEKLAESLNKGR